MRHLLALLILCVPTIASARQVADATEAPYFVVPGVDASVDALPLREVAVHADISGVVASVTVTQLWENTGGSTLEATYVFPLSTRAAVHAMEMRVGGRRIVATIKEKEAARQIYEDAKAAGKTAALLEQSRPNMFTTQVANVQPGDVIEVELKYVELLLPEDGVFSFVVPKVVGPRYVSPSEAFPDVPWSVIAKSDARAPAPTLHAWPITISLQGGVPVQWVHSSTHEVDVSSDDDTTEIELVQDPGEVDATADFVLDYALGDDTIAAGAFATYAPAEPDKWMPHDKFAAGDEGGHFMALVAPPERVDPALIPPREYVFIVDTSGSMEGWPLDMATQLVGSLVDDLDADDRINIMCFSGDSEMMAPRSVAATPANKRLARSFLARQRSGGGTELLPALKQALRGPDSDLARTFVVVTDGYVTVEAEAIDLIRANLDKANVFAIGVGQGSVNRHLLEAVAHAGGGEPYIVTNEATSKDVAERFIDDVRAPVLTDIQVSFEGMVVHDLTPSRTPTLYASRPLVVSGTYSGKPGTLVITGRTGAGPWVSRTKIVAGHHPAVPLLWARARIAELSDFAGAHDAPNHKAEVTQLGLDYALVTQHTSFIAVYDGAEVAATPGMQPSNGLAGEIGGMGFAGDGIGGGGMGFVGGSVGFHGSQGGMGTGRGPKSGVASEASEKAPTLAISLDKVNDSALRKVLTQRAAMLRTCSAQSTAQVADRMLWTLTIAANGTVVNIKLTSARSDPPLERCLMRQLRRLKVDGGARTVTIELTITP